MVVVVEDVDLIAEHRGMHPGQHPLLFALVNEMDGLGEDVDVAFVLTTNRVDLLEPALAARPGRVDQAVEIPVPDAAGRRRLIELYKGNVALQVADLSRVVERTDGVTAPSSKSCSGAPRSWPQMARTAPPPAWTTPAGLPPGHLRSW